ncbi:hypothetical protein AURDEDRAFT_160866 [Auricularia subglabra TFB-10046 SS5]|nr:hypothetical protein AURDEDRAFT_160866 [Auricularia subglabra TFB-10046 SS5]
MDAWRWSGSAADSNEVVAPVFPGVQLVATECGPRGGSARRESGPPASDGRDAYGSAHRPSSSSSGAAPAVLPLVYVNAKPGQPVPVPPGNHACTPQTEPSAAARDAYSCAPGAAPSIAGQCPFATLACTSTRSRPSAAGTRPPALPS